MGFIQEAALDRTTSLPLRTPPAPPALEGALRGRYRAKLAEGDDEMEAVLRLRFDVFNLELGEGLAASYATGLDRDIFDQSCHHLLVQDATTGEAVGTYRMQTAEMAARGAGFYSDGEFDLSALPRDLLASSVEVGRACVSRDHRNTGVLFLLWKGLASYMQATGKRYLFGCSSLTSQDTAAGLKAYEQLAASGHVHPLLSVRPRRGFECAAAAPAAETVRLPILFRTYLRHGAKVCGPPAIDREFATIDFLTLLDLQDLPADARRLYFGATGSSSHGETR